MIIFSMSFRYQMSVKQNLRMWMVNSQALRPVFSRSLSTGWSERPFPTSGATTHKLPQEAAASCHFPKREANPKRIPFALMRLAFAAVVAGSSKSCLAFNSKSRLIYIAKITKGSVSYLSSPCFSTSIGGIGGPARVKRGILAPPSKIGHGFNSHGWRGHGPHIRGTLSIREMSL